MLRRPKCSKNEVVAPKEEEEEGYGENIIYFQHHERPKYHT
jgi:hypothetical protein